jgi:hypothetical protein
LACLKPGCAARASRRVFTIRRIDFARYEFATFFTQGMPYGLFLENVIPFSHVWRQIDCGIFIAVNLMDDDNPRGFGSSLHFSPQFFASEETDDVIQIFAANNFVTKELVGEDATTRNLSDFASYYPYDVLHKTFCKNTRNINRIGIWP